MLKFEKLFGGGLFAIAITVGSGAHAQEAGAERKQQVVTREARVVFESGRESLAIYRSSYRNTAWASAGTVSAYGAQTSYERICVAPCEATLSAGTDTYAVSRVSGSEESPRGLGGLTLPAGSSRVKLTYHDRSSVRLAGDLVLGGAVAGMIYGLAVIVGLGDCHDQACTDDILSRAEMIGGISLGSAVLGGVLASFDDRVDAVVSPRAQPVARALPHARGVALRGHF